MFAGDQAAPALWDVERRKLRRLHARVACRAAAECRCRALIERQQVGVPLRRGEVRVIEGDANGVAASLLEPALARLSTTRRINCAATAKKCPWSRHCTR